jgi:hypothetical protein
MSDLLYTPANENLVAPNIQTGTIYHEIRPGPPRPVPVSIPGIPAGDLRLGTPPQEITRPNGALIRRMEAPDLTQLQDWLAFRLHERHPEATAAQIRGFLHGCIGNNEWFFVHTDLACGLAQLVRLPLEPQPVVQDFFVFARKDKDTDDLIATEADHQAASIYPAMASWAAHQNASRLIIPRYSDVKEVVVMKMMGQTPKTTGARQVWLGRVY